MMDGEQETLASFWIDKDDISRCEDNLMVTKSLRIKQGKILDSSCKEKYEGYQCWREHKGVLLNHFYHMVHFQSATDLPMHCSDSFFISFQL